MKLPTYNGWPVALPIQETELKIKKAVTWSNCDSNPLQDLIDWAECVEHDPLKEDHLSVIELEEIIKKVKNART